MADKSELDFTTIIQSYTDEVIDIDDLEVLTDGGFQPFKAIKKVVVTQYIKIDFSDGSYLTCSNNHKIKTNRGFLSAEQLEVGDVCSQVVVSSIATIDEPNELYDLIEVSGGNHYITNNVTSHNCAFVENWEDFASAVLPTVSSSKNSKMIFTSCVTEDTYVWSDQGLKQVKDFVDYNQVEHPNMGYPIPRYKVVGFDGYRSGGIFVNSGTADIRKITTTHSSVSCSLNHKVYACKNGTYGWYKSEQLEIGDYVAIRYGFNQWVGDDDISDVVVDQTENRGVKNRFTVPDKINSDLAYLIGLYIAEGSIYKGSVTITCGDSHHVIEAAANCGLSIKTYDGLRHHILSTQFVDFLEQLGISGKDKACSKHIPQRLTRCSQQVISALLRGIFDGDGSIIEKKSGVCINLTSISEQLIDHVRMILINFGILTHKYSKRPAISYLATGRHNTHVLEIYGEHADKFNQLIGFGFTRKQNKQKNIRSQTRTNGHDIIPFFYDLKKQRGFKLKSGQSGLKIKKHLSRTNALNWVGDMLPEIISPNIKWDKIKSIEQLTDKVYDFSLDHIEGDKWCHSVLYNGIVGHQTPNGLNHFYDYCQLAKEGKNEFAYIEVPWWKVDGRDEEWKQKTLAEMNFNTQKFEQEQEVAFLGSSGTLISGAALKRLEAKDPIHHNPHNGISIYTNVQRNHTYVMLIDTSRGKGLDYSAFHVIDVTSVPYKQVCTFTNNMITPTDYAEIIANIGRYYNKAHLLIELNDLGSQVSDILFMSHEYENIFMTESHGKSGKRISAGFGNKVERGITTTSNVRNVGCSMLKLVVEQNQIEIVDAATISELKTFSLKGGKYQAEQGKHDDLVMGLVLFGWLSNQDYFKILTENDINDHLRDMDDNDIEEVMLGFGIVVNDGAVEEEFNDVRELPYNDFNAWLAS